MASSRVIAEFLSKASENSLANKKNQASSTSTNSDINISNEIDPRQINLDYKIGSGGFGTVFKATFNGKPIAVKQLHSFAEDALQIFAVENEKFKKVDSFGLNGVIKYLGYVSSEKSPMILMEYVYGCDVEEIINSQIYKHNTLSWTKRYEILETTIAVCCELHDKNIVHGDLKWKNILYRMSDKTIKLIDFSFSQFLKPEINFIRAEPRGTLPFMAPEIITDHQFSFASDVFAVGGLIYHIAGEGTPFCYIKDNLIIKEELSKGRRSLISDFCPKELAKLITWCWEQDPNKRPTMQQLKQEVHVLAEKSQPNKAL